MSDAKHKPGTGTFTKGLRISDKVHHDFELREATTDDLIEAEELAPADKQIAFARALAAIQLVRVGTYEGPFTPELLGRLSTGDFYKLRKAQLELEEAGNA